MFEFRTSYFQHIYGTRNEQQRLGSDTKCKIKSLTKQTKDELSTHTASTLGKTIKRYPIHSKLTQAN